MTSEARTLALTVQPAMRMLAHGAKPARRSEIGLAAVILVATTLLPLPIAAPIAVAALIGWIAAELGGTHSIATFTSWHGRALRRESRERALLCGGIERNTLGELDHLVTAIAARDGELVKRLDLEGLLDRYVTLALAHGRAVRAAAMSDRKQLELIRDEQRQDPAHDPRRLELCERRLRCLDQCEAKVQWLADEIAIVCDTVRLIAQRAACPDEPIADDVIERSLLELDVQDDAARDLG
jgi:hypothetical protein